MLRKLSKEGYVDYKRYQNVMGTAVFWGMLVATALGVFLIPGNYTFVESLGRKKAAAAADTAPPLPAPSHGGGH